jgi:hypothetical protein
MAAKKTRKVTRPLNDVAKIVAIIRNKADRAHGWRRPSKSAVRAKPGARRRSVMALIVRQCDGCHASGAALHRSQQRRSRRPLRRQRRLPSCSSIQPAAYASRMRRNRSELSVQLGFRGVEIHPATRPNQLDGMPPRRFTPLVRLFGL